MADSVCASSEAEAWLPSPCEGLPADYEHEGKQYCVLHFPSGDKDQAAFMEAIEKKLKTKDFNFRRVYFPASPGIFRGASFLTNAAFEGEVDFSSATFEGWAIFRYASFKERTTFSRATFKDRANFVRATFSRADFDEATFKDRAYFFGAAFSRADFSEAIFVGETDFGGAQFSGEKTEFRGAQFSGGRTHFSDAQFSGGRTDFRGAQFGGGKTYFRGTQFSGDETDFGEATFNGQPSFYDTTFRDATFATTTFQRGADFTGAKFDGTRAISNGTHERTTNFRMAIFGGELDFGGAEFKGFTDFYRTNFLDAVKFVGGEREDGPSPLFAPEGQVSFKRARIDKPELFTFDTLLLRPSWFVGVDARKFDFTAVQWPSLFHSNGSEDTFDEAFDREIKGIREKGEPGSPYDLLAQACRRLSANAEDNREYPLANDFHYWAMDAVRKEQWNHIKSEKTWRSIWKHLSPITTCYWALSGYGVRAGRALGVLLTIAIVFAALYMMIGHASLRVFPIGGIWEALADAGRAVMYSLGVMARLRPEPIPKEMGLFQILVTVEGILGPLQIALLALAVRRQVMR